MPTRDDVVERMSTPVANAPVQPKVNEVAFKGVFDISDADGISPEAWERCKSERTLSAQRTVTTRSPLEWFHLAKHLCMSSMSSLWSSSFAKWIPCRISFRILVPGTRMMAVLFENDCCMTETTLAKPELSSCDVCSARTKIAVQRCRVVPRVASTAGRGNLWAHSDGGFSSRSGSNGRNRPVGSSSTLTGPIVMDINLCRDKNE